jgi:oxygen-independent coproporphyrinogen-3 oxidase
MEPAWVARIIAQARALWPADTPVEVTLEANPTDAEAGRFEAFAAAGVNRLSLGVQALDEAALKALGRNHGADEARRAARLARRVFPRLSLDLIYARPGQSARAWAAELGEALALEPDHLSPYQLTIEAGTAFDRAVRLGRLAPPGDEAAAELYETTQAVLEAAGFEAYEVSNHARGEDARSRHNLAYWRGWDYVGAGPGAHGRLSAPAGRLATVAAARVADYLARVEQAGTGFSETEALDAKETALERLLMGLRLSDGVAWRDLEPLALAPSSRRVRDLAELGLVAPAAAGLSATPAGRAVLDRVIEALAVCDLAFDG